jgi:hypothetical protein
MTLYATAFTQSPHEALLPLKTQFANERDTLAAFLELSPTVDLDFAENFLGAQAQ